MAAFFFWLRGAGSGAHCDTSVRYVDVCSSYPPTPVSKVCYTNLVTKTTHAPRTTAQNLGGNLIESD